MEFTGNTGNALSRITSETFPDNETVNYNYNTGGWLASVTGYIDDIQYNARGQKTQLTYANKLTTTWAYNANNFRVTTRTTSGNQQNLAYGYDNNGNVTSITDTLFTSSRAFTYDDLNRMITGSGTFGVNQAQQNCSYTYSSIGNLTNKCGAVLSYGDANHPSAVTNHSVLAKNYTYDANGNMLTRGNQTLTWNIDNRVSQIAISGGGSTQMEYDYSGMRVKKSTPLITLYPFAGYEIDPNGTTTKFINIGGEAFASKKKTTGGTETQYFYHNDHLGGVNVITNIVGTQVQLNEYDPWGAVSRAVGTIDPDQRFTGQKLDPETGLYYYGGRYYDAEIGRFISADPFVQTIFDPQNLNRYSYVLNSPQNYTDPSGYFHHVKKKKGGFWRSGLGIFLRAIIASIAMVFNMPMIATGEGGGGYAPPFVQLIQSIRDATDDENTARRNGGGGIFVAADSPGPQIPGLSNAGGGGFPSPALQLAMETGCDVCSDSGWDLLRSILNLFGSGEAWAHFDRGGGGGGLGGCGGGRGSGRIGGRPLEGGSVSDGPGAMRRNEYVGVPKHGTVARGQAGAAPVNGQRALDVSVQVKTTSPTRVGVDYETGQFVVFHENFPNQRIFSGHVRPWAGPGSLSPEMRAALIKSGLTDAGGRIQY